MFRFLLRRLLLACLMLVLITFLVYGLIRAIPGTPLDAVDGDAPGAAMTPEDLDRLNQQYGLDKPWYVAYFIWIKNLASGDLGQSRNSSVGQGPVSRLIGERIGPTLLLSISSLVLIFGLSIPLGLWTAARNGRIEERVVAGSLYALYSLPVFMAALFLQLLFAVHLDWLPLMHMHSDDYDTRNAGSKAWDLFRHALLPVACYTYGSLAYVTRFIHNNLQEVLRQDYIRTARAKGVAPWGILTRHAFRNTLIPLVTLLGISLPALLSGSIVTEQIFSWPGLGQLFFSAVHAREYPVIMALTLLYSVLALLGQLLADLLYAWVDPRIGYT